MNNVDLVPVILSGGSGTRLWPLSRSEYPKQFVRTQNAPLFEDTLMRTAALRARPPIVVCNESQRFFAEASLRNLGLTGDLLLEHTGRNTAPAIALAAHCALSRYADPYLLVLPSDHHLEPVQAFVEVVNNGLAAAKANRLVTFGVTPTRAETGYGYVCPAQAGGPLYQDVKKFEEKPTADRAGELIARGCLWNSGIFLFRAVIILEEMNSFCPDITACTSAMWESRKQDLGFTRFDPTAAAHCPSISLDHAVMEKTAKAALLPLSAAWSDLGSWEAMYEIAPKDKHGNVLAGDVIAQDVGNSFIQATDKLVAALGLEGLVVIETPDAVLVADKAQSQDLKKIIATMQKNGRPELHSHLKVYRPWGAYQLLARSERFQVKRLDIKPGEGLSLQKHHHRAEHWVVVGGTAKVNLDGQEIFLTEDQGVHIPANTVHGLANPGKIPLVIIETQTGSYLGEDDIVRLEDKYGRLAE